MVLVADHFAGFAARLDDDDAGRADDDDRDLGLTVVARRVVREHDVVAGEPALELFGDGVGELRRAAQAECPCERAEPDAERGEGDEAE